MTASTSALERLSLEEKDSLLSGQGKWSLPALPAIGLDSIVMCDGPAAVKGDGSLPIRSHWFRAARRSPRRGIPTSSRRSAFDGLDC